MKLIYALCITCLVSCNPDSEKDSNSNRAGGGRRSDAKTDRRDTAPQTSVDRKSREEAGRIFGSSQPRESFQSASFADAMRWGRALIEGGEVEPEKLMEFFRSIDDVAKSEKLCVELVDYLAATDPHRALRAAEGLPPGRLVSRAYSQIASLADFSELPNIYQAAQKYGLPEVERAVKNQVASRVANMDANQLTNFRKSGMGDLFAEQISLRDANLSYSLKGLQQSDFSDPGKDIRYRAEVLRAATVDNPERAAAWISKNLETVKDDVTKQPSIIDNAVNAYLAKSPSAALDWANSIQSDDLSGRAVRSGIDSWLQIDSMAAAKWAGKQPQGYGRDVACLAIAQFSLKDGDRELAKSWANQVQSEKLKKAAQKISQIK